MSLRFQVRSTQLNAYYAVMNNISSTMVEGLGTSPPYVLADGASSTFGGVVIKRATAGETLIGLYWNGYTNYLASPALTVLMRIVPRYSGVQANTQPLLSTSDSYMSERSGFYSDLDTNGCLALSFISQLNGGISSPRGRSSILMQSGIPVDIGFSWTGTNVANNFKISVDGSVTDTLSIGANSPIDCGMVRGINFGFAGSLGNKFSNFDINELVIWDDVEDMTQWAGRTGFISAPNFDGATNSDPGPNNILYGTPYTISGVKETGVLQPKETRIGF